MSRFFSRLSYSFGNEDPATEHKALKIKPTDTVLTVTASGDRPLNLLTADCEKLITVDANPIQNALFDLKKTALQNLDYTSYMAFLGAADCSKRMETFHTLQNALDPTSAALWNHHKKMIARGVLFQGTIERLMKGVSFSFRILRGKKTKALFAFDDLEEQRRYLETQWKSTTLKKLFELALHPKLTRLFVGDPGLYEYVDPHMHIGKHLYNRVHGSLEKFLAKESILISLLMHGKVDEAFLPPYLSQQGGETIKRRLEKISCKTQDLISYLEQAEDNSIDCFSTSDVASYIGTKDFHRMLREIVRTAKPDARFCIRQFLTYHKVPYELAHHFVRDNQLEQELEQEDRCCVYHFMTGVIEK